MGLIKYMLGAENRKNIRRLSTEADKVLALEEKYKKLSDEELKGMTETFKKQLKDGKSMDDIMFEAYAVVREASDRVLKMRHFKVQVMGGIALHQGRITEMKTGEGKTLVATLPAYLNALNGKGVHIVTVNDYLARRDAEWMGKLYNFLGLSVGVVSPQMPDDMRKIAYASDITYSTNNELGFDYLRDNLKIRLEDRVQRPLVFAIVDEVDSILIDEARTPLIISGAGGKSSELYVSANRFAKELEEDVDFEIKIKEKTVTITEEGTKKAEEYFGIENLGDIENTELNHHIQQALKAQYIFKKDVDYIVSDGEVVIVDEFTGRLMVGRRYSDGLHQAIEAKEGVVIRSENKTHATITFQNYFRIYDKLSGMTGTAKTEEDEFKTIYRLDVIEIPTNLESKRIDMNDVIYKSLQGKMRAIVAKVKECYEKGQPVLIGTTTVDKSEEMSKLLQKEKIPHNMLNAKNNEKEAEIIAQAGRLKQVTVATNMAGRGTDILLGGNPEYQARRKMIDSNVDEEKLSVATGYAATGDEEILKIRQEYQTYLNNFKEKTDKEKEEVKKLGGLFIIGTERHESRRIDNQLRGRAGRQGDEGTTVFYVSLEDDLIKRFGGDTMIRVYDFFKIDEDTPISFKMISKRVEQCQKTIEGRNFMARKNILQYDDVMNTQRKVIYEERDKILSGLNVHDNIVDMIDEEVECIVRSTREKDVTLQDRDIDKVNSAIEEVLLLKGANFVTQDMINKWDEEYLIEKLKKKIKEDYLAKIERYKEREIKFDDIERFVLLKTIDRLWVDHIDIMDQLRRGVGLRAYGNVDPVIAYKREGYDLFEEMKENLRRETVKLLLKGEMIQAPKERTNEVDKLRASGGSGNRQGEKVPYKANKMTGRNEPCPCGSGKKYKNCCGKNE